MDSSEPNDATKPVLAKVPGGFFDLDEDAQLAWASQLVEQIKKARDKKRGAPDE